MRTFGQFLTQKQIQSLSESFSNASLAPQHIYDFYYLAAALSYGQIDEDDRFVASYYLQELQHLYLDVFSKLLIEQLAKYQRRGRLDTINGRLAYDVKELENAPNQFDAIKQMMAKTYRSDMTRRNVVWNNIAEYVEALSRQTKPDKITYYIDRINNSIHNTENLVLEKFPNGHELIQAFNVAHLNSSPENYRRFVSPEIRRLVKVWSGPSSDRGR